jgi:hypothetical protein
MNFDGLVYILYRAKTCELRRISERSISIPSSDEEGNLIKKLREASAAKGYQDNIPSPIHESTAEMQKRVNDESKGSDSDLSLHDD